MSFSPASERTLVETLWKPCLSSSCLLVLVVHRIRGLVCRDVLGLSVTSLTLDFTQIVQSVRSQSSRRLELESEQSP